MSIVTGTAPTSPAPAVRTCASCKTNPLSYNNTTGICAKCQKLSGGRIRSKRVNGHGAVRPFARGLQLARRAEVAEPAAVAKPGGADRQDGPARSNGAQPMEDRVRSFGRTDIESRVDLVLSAIPAAEKMKMLSAWLTGTL